MRKIRLTLSALFLILTPCFLYSGGNYITSYAILNFGSGNVYYDCLGSTGNPDFNNNDLGDFKATQTLFLNGSEVNVWEDDGHNVAWVRMFYRVYMTTETPPSFTQIDLDWRNKVGNDEKWDQTEQNISCITGRPAGDYYLEIYYHTRWEKFGNDFELFDNNSGINYKATFTILANKSNTSGDWSSITWSYESIPSLSDPVHIQSGHDVTISASANANHLVIDGTLTILSGSSSTGSLITNGTVSGDVTVQRYIPGWSKGLTGFHLLSSPVQNQLISTEFVDVSGSIPATVDFYYWNEPHNYWINIKNDELTYNKGTSWENFSNADNPSFIVGKGYLVGYSTVQNKEFSGTPNTGDLVSGTGIPAITYTSGEGNGWNLIGNPYPSAIDWGLGTWSRTNLNGSVYVQNGATGNYVSWNGSTGGLTNGIIPAMQGFFVKAESEGASLTIPNLSRVHSTSNIYKNSEKSVENVLVLEINNENYNDQLYLQFLSQASQNYDNDYDAYKLFGTGDSPQIYSKSIDGKLLSINALPIETDELIIPVNVKIIHDGLHSIALSSNTMLSGVPIYLKDKKLNLTHEISTNKNYSFEGLINDQPDRFEIQFKSTGVYENPNLSHPLTFYTPNTLNIRNLQPGTYQITVSDIAGRRVATKQVSTDGSVEMPVSLRMGVYIVEISSESARFANKIIIK